MTPEGYVLSGLNKWLIMTLKNIFKKKKDCAKYFS